MALCFSDGLKLYFFLGTQLQSIHPRHDSRSLWLSRKASMMMASMVLAESWAGQGQDISLQSSYGVPSTPAILVSLGCIIQQMDEEMEARRV